MTIRPPHQRSCRFLAALAGLAAAHLATMPAQAAPAGAARAVLPPAPSRSAVGRAVAPRLLSVAQAGARARATHRPVVASALTTPTSVSTVHPDGKVTVTESLLPVRAWMDGRWRALDPDLRAGPRHTVIPAVTVSGLVLSGGGRGPLAVMDNHGWGLAVSWPTPLPRPVLSGATATYRGVLPGVSLVVTVNGQGGFSEVLVVASARAAADPALVRLVLGASAPGLRVAVVPGGGLRVGGHGARRPLFSAPPPLVWDSAAVPAGTKTVTGPGGQVLAARSGLPAVASAAGPGVGSRVARVPVRVSGGRIVLSPPRSALAGRGTVYPVYVDPSFEPDPVAVSASNWTQVDSGYPSSSSDWDESSDLQVGKCDFSGCNGIGVVRSFFSMAYPTAEITSSTSIDSAYVDMTDAWSATCTNEAVRFGVTGGVSSSTDWSNQPGWWNGYQTQSFHFGCGGSYTQDNVVWNVLSYAQSAQSGGWTGITFSLQSDNEGSDLGWKQFLSGSGNLTLSITYHNPPSQPANLQTAPAGGCAASATGEPQIGNDAITLSATVGDADDGDGDSALSTTFTVYNASGGTVYTPANPVQTGNAPGGVPAQVTIPLSTVESWAGPATYYWKAYTQDAGSPVLTSPVAGPCYFEYQPNAPASVIATLPSPASAQIGGTIAVTFSPSNASCSPNPCPASYTYQAGVAAPVTVPADGNGDWTGAIRVTQFGPIPLTVYGSDAAGNLGPLSHYELTGEAPSTPYPDGYFTGGGYPSLLTTSAVNPGLWLSPGTGNGAVGAPVQIGALGTGISEPGGPGDWSGVQVLHGDFFGDGVQDVLAYNTATGGGSLIAGSGAAVPLQPFGANQVNIPVGTFADPALPENPATGLPYNPVTLVAAGDASEYGTGLDDVIGIVGDTADGYNLDLFSTACNLGDYGWCQLLSSQAPDPADHSWGDYTLATAEVPDTGHPAGNPDNVALFALSAKDGTLWETTNPSQSPSTPVGDTGSVTVLCSSSPPSGTPCWTKLTVPWGTTPPSLVSADVNNPGQNGAGQVELWATSDGTATPYLLTGTATAYLPNGTTVSAEGSGPATLSYPAHEWPLTNSADFSGGTCEPVTSPGTALDIITGSTAAITGTYSWGCDATLGTDLSLTAPGSYATPASTTISDTATKLSLSLWFKTTTADGVLASADAQPISSGSTTTSGFDPVMYIGSDGKLNAAWSPLTGDVAITSQTAVDGGVWHHAVLTACGGEEGLTIDGQPQATVIGTPNLTFANPVNLTFGAGYIGANWPDERYSGQTATADYFTGQLADVTLSAPATCNLPPVTQNAPTAVAASNGTTAVFAVRSDGNVWEQAQATAGGPFTGWTQLTTSGGFAGTPSAVMATSGAISVYVRGASGTVWRGAQSQAFGAFTWSSLGGGSVSGDPSAVVTPSGVQVVYATATDGNVWGQGQSTAGGPFTGWQQLTTGGGFVGRVSAVVASSGAISVYVRGASGTVWRGAQSQAFGAFTWSSLGGGSVSGDPSAVVTPSGVQAVYATATDGNVWGQGQSTAGGPFTGWQRMTTGGGFVGRVSAVVASSGAISVYVRGASGTVWRGAQSQAFGAFTWTSLGGGNINEDPTAVVMPSGVQAVYATATDGNVWVQGQATAGGPFTGWTRLN